MPPRATLELVGPPGTAVSVFTESAWDAASPPIFEGTLAATAPLRLRVPRLPLRVVASACGVVSVRFGDGEQLVQVNLLPAAPG